MSTTESLCTWFDIGNNELTKEEISILETDIFVRICEELKEAYRVQHKNYFRLIKYNEKMENDMTEANYMRCIINDILSTEEYTLPGIACYIQIPEEVIYDVAAGLNIYPSAILLRKLVELHRSVRRELYDSLFEKVKEKISPQKSRSLSRANLSIQAD